MHKVPTLLVDRNQCLKNIEKIKSKISGSRIELRPHFKTHQSIEVGKLFKESGIKKITVSSFQMAEFFAMSGWYDITVAFPVNILEIDRINYLASSITLNIVVESLDHIIFLNKELIHPVRFFIQIDAGYGRTGIIAENHAYIDSIIQLSDDKPYLTFAGFLSHSGHSYYARDKESIQNIHKNAKDRLNTLMDKYKEKFPKIQLSYGDTPTASVADDFTGIDELRAGNFVYYDVTQNIISSCSLKEIAVAVECPIVAMHRERNEIVIYGGGVHFSKDRVDHPTYGTIYGLIVEHKGKLWGDHIPGAYLKKISQEHGIISMPADIFENYKIGDTIKVLPVHSCMTADLMKKHTEIL